MVFRNRLIVVLDENNTGRIATQRFTIGLDKPTKSPSCFQIMKLYFRSVSSIQWCSVHIIVRRPYFELLFFDVKYERLLPVNNSFDLREYYDLVLGQQQIPLLSMMFFLHFIS